jgi:hypothetical protein
VRCVELTLTPVVRLELVHETLAKDAQGREDFSGSRASRRPGLRPLRLAAQLTPHLELDDLRRTRRMGPRHGVQMPLHQLSPL